MKTILKQIIENAIYCPKSKGEIWVKTVIEGDKFIMIDIATFMPKRLYAPTNCFVCEFYLKCYDIKP